RQLSCTASGHDFQIGNRRPMAEVIVFHEFLKHISHLLTDIFEGMPAPARVDRIRVTPRDSQGIRLFTSACYYQRDHGRSSTTRSVAKLKIDCIPRYSVFSVPRRFKWLVTRLGIAEKTLLGIARRPSIEDCQLGGGKSLASGETCGQGDDC